MSPRIIVFVAMVDHFAQKMGIKYILNDFNVATEAVADSENMDSIHRVSIFTVLEEEYDIIFKLKEISSWNTVSELAAILEKKL